MHKCTSFTIILAESCVNLSIFVRLSQFSVLRTISEIAAITLLICWSIGVIVFCFLCCGGLTCICRCKIFCLTCLLIGFYKFYRFSFNGFLIVHYTKGGLDIALKFLRLSALLLNSRVNYFFWVYIHSNSHYLQFHNTALASCLLVLLFVRVFLLVVSLCLLICWQNWGKFLKVKRKSLFSFPQLNVDNSERFLKII